LRGFENPSKGVLILLKGTTIPNFIKIQIPLPTHRSIKMNIALYLN